MHDQQEVTSSSPQNASGFNKALLYRRTILSSLVISVGGMSAFVLWTLPILVKAPLQRVNFLSSIMAFLPPFFVVAALLLGFIVWWMRVDQPPQKDQQLARREYKGRETPTEVQGNVSSRYHHARNISVRTLREKRKQQFSTGREYKGKVRKPTVVQMDASLASVPIEFSEGSSATSSGASLPVERMPPGAALTFPLLSEATPSHNTVNTVAMPEVLPPVSIFLLKEVTIEVRSAEGIKRTIQLRRKRREDGRYIERDLLAYLASWRGLPVGRDKLLEAVFAYGLSDEKYNLTNLTNQFNKCTQFLRKDINQIASEAGIPELMIIASQRDEWRLLTEECRVVDLNEVERLYGLLKDLAGEDFLRPDVQDACQALIDLYRGDFLEDYIEDTVREGSDDWVHSWIRNPYTSYRDKYLHALWYRAEYWRVKGDLSTGTSEAERILQRNWYESAAKLYQSYALHVPTAFTNESAMLFDVKIEQRKSLGERALRACLDMYTATKNTQAGDNAYLTFARRMGGLTHGTWKPRADTIEAWRNVREQTKSHRFAPRVTPHDLPREDTDNGRDS